MNTYLIQFYSNTDLRAETSVEAFNELQALAIATAKNQIEEWSSVGTGFHIKIMRYDQ